MHFLHFAVVVLLFGVVSSFRINLPKSQQFRDYSHRTLSRASNPFFQHSPSFIARPKFIAYCGKGLTHATRSPRKYSLQSVFHRLLSALNWFLSKFKSQPKQLPVVRENLNAKRTSNTTFLSAPSVPINKMINLSIGRQYAEAKLQEIDSYFRKIGKGKSSSELLTTLKAQTTVEMNSTELQILQTYERKRSVLDIPDAELKGKRVLLRCNLDMPVQDGKILEDSLLYQSLPTMQYLTERGARVIVAGHRGPPTGKGYEAEFSLSPVAVRLGQLLNQSVAILPDCTAEALGRAVSELPEGSVVVLENLRFHHGETLNNADFAKNLTAHVDLFVNDDLSSAHAALASTEGVARWVSTAVTGLSLKKDLDVFNATWTQLVPPLVAVVSTGNFTSQASFLEKVITKAARVVLTGSLAVSFLHTRSGHASNQTVPLAEKDQADLARRLDQLATAQNVTLSLKPDVEDLLDASAVAGEGAKETLWWAGATAHRPDEPFLRVTTKEFNHTFSSYDNSMELLKGNALPGVCFLNKF